jgi:hypothetical protein
MYRFYTIPYRYGVVWCGMYTGLNRFLFVYSGEIGKEAFAFHQAASANRA